jgi:hypothetical protein
MNIVLQIIRWLLVLPASLAAVVIVYVTAKSFDDIGGALANFFIGPTGDGTIFCGLIAGCAYVGAGVGTAPAGKRYVAVFLASLPALLSVAVIALSIINLFHHFGTPNYSSVLRTISIAGGAGMIAWEIYWEKVSPSMPSASMPPHTEPDSEEEEIDFDKLACGLDYDEEE